MPRRGCLLAVLALLVPATAWAGLAPLERVGRAVAPASKPALELLEDSLELALQPERGLYVEQVRLRNAGPAGVVLLGVPRPVAAGLGAQDLAVRFLGEDAARPAPRVTPWVGQDPARPRAWLAFEVELAAGQTLGLELSWWQPHGAEERYGVWRLLQAEDLWTTGLWAGKPARVSRRVRLEPGAFYVASEPEARALEDSQGGDWERMDRLLERVGSLPAPDERWAVFFWLRDGAQSACAGRPWDALDGEADSRWAPTGCPGEVPELRLLASCRGVGLLEPDCTQGQGASQVAAALLQAPGAPAGARLEVEGWFGPHRVWSAQGAANTPLWLLRAEPVTSLRFAFPGGFPAGGAELQLMRVDLERSSPGAEAHLARGKARPRMERNCTYKLRLVNPIWFQHITVKLKPSLQARDWLVELDCGEGRGRALFYEPTAHDEVPKEVFRDGLSDELYAKFKDELEQHEKEHGGHAGEPPAFRRKHPDRIELDVDPTCKTRLIGVTTAHPYCQAGPRTPEAPEIELRF
ncbi:MAG TPA: hypothetical protein PK668_04560 [Myxococcota bacterium]|nr:hypothetical protein [Myxococcota bacterium]HRY92132.1 hypothetical protein [Myxococcota bacterium]HSA21727.1 hypothetical protein [Myxococcota bacterium]